MVKESKGFREIGCTSEETNRTLTTSRWLNQDLLVDAVDFHGCEFSTPVNECLSPKTMTLIALPVCH